jgi:hypothetical protein
MRRIALFVAALVAAVGASVYSLYPDKFTQYAAVAIEAGLRLWQNVEANPAPVCIAVATFLLTVIYHKARGKSLRESVEVAATRVTVVPVSPVAAENETPVIRRAKARATRTQLLADQISLQNRQRKLPDEIVKAEKDVCYAKQALAESERSRAERHATHDEVVARLESLRREKAAAKSELAEIESELKKMATLV